MLKTPPSPKESNTLDSLTSMYRKKQMSNSQIKSKSKSKPKFQTNVEYKKGVCKIEMKSKMAGGDRLVRKEKEYSQLLNSNPKIQKLNELREKGIKYEDLDKVKSDLNITEPEARMYDRQKRKAARIERLGLNKTKTEPDEEKESDAKIDKEVAFMQTTKPVSGQMDYTQEGKTIPYLEDLEKDKSVTAKKEYDKTTSNSSEAFKLASKDKSRIKKDDKGNKYIEDSNGNRFKYIFKDSPKGVTTKTNTSNTSTSKLNTSNTSNTSNNKLLTSELSTMPTKKSNTSNTSYKGMVDLINKSTGGNLQDNQKVKTEYLNSIKNKNTDKSIANAFIKARTKNKKDW